MVLQLRPSGARKPPRHRLPRLAARASRAYVAGVRRWRGPFRSHPAWTGQPATGGTERGLSLGVRDDASTATKWGAQRVAV